MLNYRAFKNLVIGVLRKIVTMISGVGKLAGIKGWIALLILNEVLLDKILEPIFRWVMRVGRWIIGGWIDKADIKRAEKKREEAKESDDKQKIIDSSNDLP